MKVILDIDNKTSWNPLFADIIYDRFRWQILNDDFDGKFTLFHQFHPDPENVKTSVIQDIFDEISKVIRTSYTHIVAYHACRIRDGESYRRQGLLPASRERLTKNARQIFKGLKGLDTALEQCDTYFDDYNGSVSLYITARNAPDCYLGGGHYLTTLASHLGVDGQNCLNSYLDASLPTFVRCSVPCDWLEKPEYVRGSLLHPYAGAIAKNLIWKRKQPLQNYEDNPCALVLFTGIPPENIEGFVNPHSFQSTIDIS